MALPVDPKTLTQAQWDKIRADALGKACIEMENDFAAIAELLGIEGEYHVSFGVEEILAAIAKMRGDT